MIIVAGVDDSIQSKRVVERAIDEGRRRQAEVHLVHAVHIPAYFDFPIDVDALIETEKRAVWEPLEASIKAADVAITTVDVIGYPAEALIDYAHSVDAGLLVLGTRERGELTALFLGSTCHRALQIAPRRHTRRPADCLTANERRHEDDGLHRTAGGGGRHRRADSCARGLGARLVW